MAIGNHRLNAIVNKSFMVKAWRRMKLMKLMKRSTAGGWREEAGIFFDERNEARLIFSTPPQHKTPP